MEILLLAFYAVGYFVLGGADIGVGMLLPYLGRTADERRRVLSTITPLFLGNEVWLVAVAGVLTGAFPLLEGRLLSGLYPVVVALLIGWIVRDVGLWTRGRVDRAAWRAMCDTAVVAGSWTVVLSWGWMFAGFLSGVVDRPLTEPAALLGIPAIAVLFATHGLAFAALRLRGRLRTRARGLSGTSGAGVTFALTSGGMALLCVFAGLRLPLAQSTADPATLALLTPALLVLTPLLVAAQVWMWWMFTRPADARTLRSMETSN
ncbi:cytochrome d ubiquinol oxidase subunit II [Microtetraspora malaysiensis]|uniref:cytochrome d ubiquinol oxidase subunit II n=1 Tax=Microtetraspora malaysiensis TaxID=161358 RepID=UPI003D89F373